jgi:O-antigen ligase
VSHSVGVRRAGLGPVLAAVAVAFTTGGLLAIRPGLGVAVLGAICFVPVVMVSVPLGIAAWITALSVVLGLATTWMELLIAAAWLGSLIASRTTIRQLLPGQQFLVGALALLLAWMSLSLLWARDAQAAWEDLRWWLVAGGLLVVLATSITTPARLRLILLAFILGALLSAGIGSLQSGPPLLAASHRFAGLDGDPNDFAGQLLVAIVFAAALAVEGRRWSVRAVLVASIVGLTLALAATQSRGGLLAAGVVVAVAVVLYGRQRRAVLLGVALVVTVSGAWFAVYPHELGRVTTVNDAAAVGRSTLWLVAWRIAADYTPEGIGLNNFRIVSPNYVRRPGLLREVEQIDSRHIVHDTYLQLLAETGIVGLTLFLAVVGACLQAARRAAKQFEHSGEMDLARLARAVMLAVVGLLTTQVFLSNGYDARFWVLLALGPAMLTLAYRLPGQDPNEDVRREAPAPG